MKSMLDQPVIVVQSDDSRAWLWPTWFHHFAKHSQGVDMLLIFATQNLNVGDVLQRLWRVTPPTPAEEELSRKIINVRCGDGGWAKETVRLCANLHQQFWFMHDDYLLTDRIRQDIMQVISEEMLTHNFLIIKACGPDAGWAKARLRPLPFPSVLSQYCINNAYLISHQTSLWAPHVMEYTIKDGWSAWDHEVKGTEVFRWTWKTFRRKKSVRKEGLTVHPNPIAAWTGPMPLPYIEAVFDGDHIRPGAQRFFVEAQEAYRAYRLPESVTQAAE